MDNCLFRLATLFGLTVGDLRGRMEAGELREWLVFLGREA